MADTTCATCGNRYDKAFTVTTASGDEMAFDSVECAAARLAPTCATCGTRILGHGHEVNGSMFCCAHCAARAGHEALADRA